MDYDFINCLNLQSQKFKKAVMRDYWEYRRLPIEKKGFGCLNIVSNEYLLQKFFEIRLEDYIRRYLVNGFLGRVLESRGNAIYPSEISNNTEKKHYSNEEYEQNVQYEFVADFFSRKKRIGIRYTDLPNNQEFHITEDIDEVCIIHWDNLQATKENDKIVQQTRNGKQIITCNIKTFMLENDFTIEEYEKYSVLLLSIVMEFQELIGVKTIPKLNSAMILRFRFDVEKTLADHAKELMKYESAEKRIAQINSNIIEDFNWAYHIIDEDNKTRYPNLEMQTKELLSSVVLSKFLEEKLYKAFIGRSDFARSFITSEYLYRQYDSNDLFDYTVIVSGYLKSIEQLLFHISMFIIDRGFKIKSSGKKLEDGSKLPYKVKFTNENLNNGWCDITMGSLSYLLKESKRDIIYDKKYKKCIFDCLQCYIKECRNGSFHKHNIENWSRVEFIRKNTMTIIIILLGICKMGKSILETEKELKIIKDDKMERIYHWITTINSEKFFIQFCDEKPVWVRLGKCSEYPSIDKNGMITDNMFLLECVDDIDYMTKKPRVMFIKRDRVPEKLWYIDENGEKIECIFDAKY